MPDPSPQQRADYLVRKLESLIREGRSERGMSFKTWQALARAELCNTFLDMERRVAKSREDATARRLVLTAVTTVVTIGFWGAAVTIDRKLGPIAAYLLTGTGFLLSGVLIEIFFRRLHEQYKAIAREKSFERIEDFDKQLKKLEAEIWLKLKKTREQAEEMEL